jgi:putative transposase
MYGEEKGAAEERLRRRCHTLTEMGMSAPEIARTLRRSVRWVRKWRKRARTATAAWYEETSRAPHHPARRCAPDWEGAVLGARRALVARVEAGGHAFIGSIGVRREIERQGLAVEGHSLRQIERIIRRHGLALPRLRRRRGGPKRFYPGPHQLACRPWDLHEVDFVGPLYRRGGARLAVLSRLDVVSGQARSWVDTRQTSRVACDCLWDDWQRDGMPRYVQMDNGASFIGGLNHPRSIGDVIRLCLYVGVEPVFIPHYTSFYNAHVESYQGMWQERVWERFLFTQDSQLQAELDKFATELAGYRAYERQLRRRPPVVPRRLRRLPENLKMPSELPLCWGQIHLVRGVAEDGAVVILNETFRVSKELAHDYVWAVIDTRRGQLTITHRGASDQPRQTLLHVPYAFREEARRRPPLPRG